jgi:hypothetical protein
LLILFFSNERKFYGEYYLCRKREVLSPKVLTGYFSGRKAGEIFL